ncbi:MoaD/ThiS family protein [Aestuariivivens sediminis]|uniref:MoaD/ThiS family protein n=1 Tax=Aestuariivivens sediminis TaxID=2913557 RepID=UPI001F59CD74|nr:MoaD/ThiS family protein [Aestuariivivens sediminis]
MNISIMYFGQIAEVTGVKEETMLLEHRLISELVSFLIQKYPELESKSFQVAQNKELVSFDTQLTGEEIALLPPFAGG